MNSNTEIGTVRWSAVINRKYGWSLALICLGVSLHAQDALVVATMLPAMVSDVGGGHLISWTISLYELGSIVASAACGLATIRYGLRIPMSLTTLVFAIGCIVSAMASEMWVVLLGRLLQGVGGGGLLAFSFVASAVLFPRYTLARVMGAISVFWGASAFIGPLLGALFVEFATWRIGFLIFAGIAAFLSFWIFIKIDDKTEKIAATAPVSSFPVWRLAWLSIGVIAIGYAGVVISIKSSPIFIILGIVSIAYFLKLDAAHERDRMLPHRPISLRHPIGAALLMIFCFSAASIPLSIFGVFIMTILHDISILTAGYIIATNAIGWSIASALISGLPERLDSKMIGLGMLLATLGIVGYVYSVPYGPVWLIALSGIIEGAGFGIAWAFISRRMCSLVIPEEIERTTSAIPTVQAVGYAVGASVLGIVANASGFSEQADILSLRYSATIIFIACVPLALLGLMATYIFVCKTPRVRT